MKDERRLIFLGSQKNPSFRVGFTKGDCLKSRALTVCRFKGGGGLARKRGGVFEGELLSQCTLWSRVSRRIKLEFLGCLCKICS